MRTRLTETKKQQIIEKISGFDNSRLLEEILLLANGDDYDGDFTTEGKFEFSAMKEELSKRLLANGFLKEKLI